MTEPSDTSTDRKRKVEPVLDVAVAIEHDEAYRVDHTLASRDGQTTEVVWLGSEGPYVRKRMVADLTSATAWERLGRARSKHLPELVDLYELPGEIVAVTTYVRGETVADLVQRDGRLLPARAVAILGDVADAARALHEVGIVHRDITPRNVMVGPDGVYLVDLGISRLAGANEEEAKRHDTHILGTWGFASPEQYGFGVTDARSDVWSMGRLLAFMLTGLYPNDEGFEKALEDPLIVPPVFRQVIDHACELAPAARPRSAEALAREADRALDEYRSRRRSKRNRRRAAVIGGLCLVAVLAIIGLAAGVIPGQTGRESTGAEAVIGEAEAEAETNDQMDATSMTEPLDSPSDSSDPSTAADDETGDADELGATDEEIYGSWFELGRQAGDQIVQGILQGGSNKLGDLASSISSSSDSQSPSQSSSSSSDSGGKSSTTRKSVDMPFKVTLQSARLVKDYKGDPAALVTIDFVNGSDETTSYMAEFMTTAYQGGRQLDQTGSPDFQLGELSRKLRPGGSNTCYELFALDGTGAIDVEVTYVPDILSGPFLSKTFNL